jgi:serine O-acetyltransferase
MMLWLNKLLGGTWVLKERCKKSKIRVVRLLLSFIYTRSLQAKGSWISENAHFESAPCFPHGIYGIFISGGVSIGSNCIIFQQVTIGSNTLIDSSGLGAPVISGNCYIGAGAKVIGEVKVGRNVRIGANAVVVRDVPDNSIVTSGEQRVITKDDPLNNRFYHKYKDQWRYFDNGTWLPVLKTHELELLEGRFSGQR